MKYRKIGLTVALVLFILVFTGLTRDEKLFQLNKSLDIYYSLIRELNMFYVDEVEVDKLVTVSMEKMLQSLDPYTEYIPESEMADFNFIVTGEYAGIGALIGKRDSVVFIDEPYEGFPAQKSGLKAGDILLKVDEKSTKGMSTAQVSSMLKGPANKEVKILVNRLGEEKEISVVREKISMDPVPYYGMLDEKVGYIRFSTFTVDCAKRVKEVFLDLKEKQGAKSLILDIRSNGGGLLNEAVDIVSLFVPKGTEVVRTRGKLKQWDKVYYATSQPADTAMPLVVLVNRGSASASEIVSGALQDLDRAVVIGSRTFGKGLVQATRDLGYNSSLKITTAKYYIPSGRCIQALDYSHRNEDGSVGIIPDSLISEFTTKNGRVVFDGGGVVPDVKIDLDKISSLSINLIQQYKYFDFGTLYASKRATVPSPEEFVITDEIFNDFKTYLKQQNFSYKSDTEAILERLVKTAKDEKYFDIAQSEFENLQAKVGHGLDKDMDDFRDEVEDFLIDEIITRFYFQKGSIRAMIRDDKGIVKAKEVLKDTDFYEKIFASGTIISMKKDLGN